MVTDNVCMHIPVIGLKHKHEHKHVALFYKSFKSISPWGDECIFWWRIIIFFRLLPGSLMSGTVAVLSGNALTLHFLSCCRAEGCIRRQGATPFIILHTAEGRGLLGPQQQACTMHTEGINFHYQQMVISVSQ